MRTWISLVVLAVAIAACGGIAPVANPPQNAPPAVASYSPTIAALLPLPPIRLTASDGTGVALTRLRARAVVADPLAFTELRLTFENPQPRILEGRFTIVLPQGASVSRLAMKIGDLWQEGEVVELQKARASYEDFLHRKQDPALLEQAAGNEFSARVFPVPAQGQKEIVVSYAQEVTRDRPYALPLRGLPALESLDVEVANGDGPPLVVRRDHVTPEGDLTLDAKSGDAGAAVRSGDFVVARVSAATEDRSDPLEAAIVLFDTSGSRALGFEAQIRVLQRLALGPARDARLTVACFDQSVADVYEGRGRELGADAVDAIRKRQALGASDMASALAWAQGRASRVGAKRIILVTDGVATAGITDKDRLRAAVQALRVGGVERIDAIAVGGIRDEAGLKAIVTAGLPRDGVVVDGKSDDVDLGQRLTRSTRSNVRVDVPGARWWFPKRLDGVQAHDEVIVYAEVPPSTGVRVLMGGVSVGTVSPQSADRELLERAFAQSKIAALLAEKQTEETRQKIVKLSTASRVVSPYTALLVLETEADYARFQIDRSSLGDVLGVDGGHVVRVHRGLMPFPFPAKPPAPERSLVGTAGFTGVVTDAATKRPLRDVIVTATSPRLQGEQVVVTDPNGFYRIPDLPAGEYVLSFEVDGFKPLRREGIRLPAGAALRLNSELLPSTLVAEEVVAVARPPTVDVGTSSVGTTVTKDFTQHIPVAPPSNRGAATRSFEAVAEVAPGRKADSYGVSVAGTSSPENTYVVDGMSVGNPGPALSPDVVRRGMVVPPHAPLANSPPQTPYLPPTPYAQPTPYAPPAPFVPNGSDQAPYTGRFAVVMGAIARRDATHALVEASGWHSEDPADVMALVALGEALEATGDRDTAARAYGSLIDLFPARADLRRFAGERLERLKGAGDALALDTFEKAETQRPDHPSSHRLVAFARLRKGDFSGAFEAALEGLQRPYPAGRFAGVDRILREDLGLVAAAWINAEPRRRDEIRKRVEKAGGALESEPSLRFVLNWETDANDVDFHIYDSQGNHAYYAARRLETGGELYADVTTGYGPECFTIRGHREGGPYRLQANYYSRGPMGYGMGKLEVIEHDGRGGLRFEERPFVVMADHATVDLGMAN
jgi:hypothetical protein